MRRCGVRGSLLALATAAWMGASTPAHADQILVEPDSNSRGYVPIEELAHEWIVEPDADGIDGVAVVRVRLALYNASAVTRDFVYLAALPAGATLTGIRTARGGEWRDDMRVPGTDTFGARVETPPELGDFAAFVVPTPTPRDVDEQSAGALTGAQIFGWGIPSGETVQVELILRAQAVLRGARWSLDLPRRGSQSVIARSRRILVRSDDGRPGFWVDDRPQTSVTETRSSDGATVAWPARSTRARGLVARAEARPRSEDDPRGPGGTLDLFLQAGLRSSPSTDHIALLVDASSSVHDDLLSHGWSLLRALADATASVRTLDALAFHRQVVPLLEAPMTTDAALDGASPLPDERQAGTDVIAAIEAAIDRLPTGSRRATVVVISDGMFPEVDPARVATLRRRLRPRGRAPIQLVFLVEEPLLGQRVLQARHPAAQLAASLGARMRRVHVPELRPEEIPTLLQASPVLGDVRVLGTSGVNLSPTPAALIGGQVEVIRGTWEGRSAPRNLEIRASAGRREIRTRVPVSRGTATTGALLSAADDVDQDRLAGGLAVPSWYERDALAPFLARLSRATFRPEGLEGVLTRPILGVYLRRHVMPRVRACYNHALGRDPTLFGRATFTYQLGKGEVMDAAVDLSNLSAEDPRLGTCLEEAAWSLKIPAGQRDTSRYLVRYPIRLVPPEGGRARGEESELSPLVEMMLDGADILAR